MLINLKKVKENEENIRNLCKAKEFHIWIWLSADNGEFSNQIKEIHEIMKEIDREGGYGAGQKLKKKIDILVAQIGDKNEGLYEMIMDFRAKL